MVSEFIAYDMGDFSRSFQLLHTSPLPVFNALETE